MTKPRDVIVSDALDNLVNQFADPLAFFRELIQNALDAGSHEIDIWTEFRPDKTGDGGVYILGVDDYGEGMDRKVIDDKLTRLFSSAKDGDFTKIGKFGIGFVSVFAIKPDAVVVDTSHGGESWRVVFNKDRSFTRIARDTPVDGTKIQVIKSATRAEYEAVAVRARETVIYWCKHVEAEIRFDNALLNQPFDLQDAVCSAHHREEGMDVVVGYRRDNQPAFGFYNKGLTLLEGYGETFFGNIAFKVSSRYLEHTLTRDNVVRDAHFQKAMAAVKTTINTHLDEALFNAVAALLKSGDGLRQDRDAAYATVVMVLARDGVGKTLRKVKELPAARDVRGDLIPWKRLLKLSGKDAIFWETTRTALADEILEAGDAVVLQALSDDDTALIAVLTALTGERRPRLSSAFYRPLPPNADDPVAQWHKVAAGVEALLQDHGIAFASVTLGHFNYPLSSLKARIVVLQPKFGKPTRWSLTADTPCKDWRRKDVVVINADHPAVGHLIGLADTEPEFAAYTLLKLVLLGHDVLTLEEDSRLANQAVEQRCQRLKISLES